MNLSVLPASCQQRNPGKAADKTSAAPCGFGQFVKFSRQMRGLHADEENSSGQPSWIRSRIGPASGLLNHWKRPAAALTHERLSQHSAHIRPSAARLDPTNLPLLHQMEERRGLCEDPPRCSPHSLRRRERKKTRRLQKSCAINHRCYAIVSRAGRIQGQPEG